MGDANLVEDYLKTKSASASFAIVSKHQHAVFGLCYRILKNKEEAEEAAQDSFMKCFDSLEKLHDPEKLKSWLLSIAYRTAIDHYRKRKPRTQELRDLRQENLLDPTDPHQIMKKKQRVKLLKRLFNNLDSLDATILNLFYIEDMTVKLIAETLNQSESNIKIRLMRSREVLRKKMTPVYRQELKP